MTTLTNKTPLKKGVRQKLTLVLAGTTLAMTGFTTTLNLFSQSALAGGKNGSRKYTQLLQRVHCRRDNIKYGEFYDYGYWGNTRYCGKKTKPGYWYWSNPYWYIWGKKK